MKKKLFNDGSFV